MDSLGKKWMNGCNAAVRGYVPTKCENCVTHYSVDSRGPFIDDKVCPLV